MWDNAPANPKLDNRRVRIAGFVVPLDGEREKDARVSAGALFRRLHTRTRAARESGHPRRRDKSANTVKLSPAAVISGTIRTVRSDTKLAVSGYEMTVDKVEPYKPDDIRSRSSSTRRTYLNGGPASQLTSE